VIAMPIASPAGAVHTRHRVRPRAQLAKRIGVGLTASGGVAMGLALYYGIDARDASNEIEAAYAAGAKWKELRPIDERGDRSATLATILGVGGGVAVAGGVTLYLLGQRAEQAPPIAIAPTRGGGRSDSDGTSDLPRCGLGLGPRHAGCYSPELRDCAVSCASPDDCAPGQVCGSDAYCAAPEIAGTCRARSPRTPVSSTGPLLSTRSCPPMRCRGSRSWSRSRAAAAS